MSEDAAHQTQAEEAGPKAEDLSVNYLVVVCGCSDGRSRVVKFDDDGKQARKVHGFIRHIQGGGLQLKKEPVLLVMDTLKNELAIEAANMPPQLGRPPRLLQQVRIALRIERPVTVGLRSPANQK